MSEIDIMQDEIAAFTAELDQIQAKIDEGRILYGSDLRAMWAMDATQAQLDKARGDIRMVQLKIKQVS